MNNAYQERNQSNPDLTRRQIKVEFGQDTNQKLIYGLERIMITLTDPMDAQ